MAVDQDSLHEASRGDDREGDLSGVHGLGRCPDGHGHRDASTVVAFGAHLPRAAEELWRVGLDHGVVVDEATSAQHHRSGFNEEGLAVTGGLNAHHDVAVQNEPFNSGVVGHHGPSGNRRFGQGLHEEPARRAHGLGQVSSRCRSGDLGEGPGVLAAGPDEPIGTLGRHLGFCVNGRLELNAPVAEELVVLQAPGDVGRDLGPIRCRATGSEEVGLHCFWGVGDAGGDLGRRAAT